MSKGRLEEKVQSLFQLFRVNVENTLCLQDVLLMLSSSLGPILKLSNIKFSDETFMNVVKHHFPNLVSKKV
jgi:hypothetical protein